MTAAQLLVDIGAAQRPGDGAAAAVEECTAALVELGAVRAVLLDPAAPIPGTLHARVFGSGLLRWNTAAEVRRALAAGPAVYVCFGARTAPAHVERLGVPVLAVARADAATAAEVVADAARVSSDAAAAAAPRLRVVFVGAQSRRRALVEALASRCDVVELDGDDLDAQRAAGYDAVVHACGGAAADLPVLRSARRVPGVLWLHGVAFGDAYRAEALDGGDAAAMLAAALRRMYGDRAPQPLLDALDRGEVSAFDSVAERRFGLLLSVDVVRAARAVVVPDAAAARRLRLDQGANGPCPPLSVCDGGDADAAAAHLLTVIAQLAPVLAA